MLLQNEHRLHQAIHLLPLLARKTNPADRYQHTNMLHQVPAKHPGKEIPWYAAYAFNYISQYYKDVDYSKLKRGEAEYQQFLQELRKADPEAFVTAQPQRAQK